VIVLGFDTATPATAVGLRLADGTTLEAHDCPNPGERPGHATRLLPLADGLLMQAGLGWEQLERIAVGVGPGTFTGLRIGVATARGLAQSLEVELVGVSTLGALAEAVWESDTGVWDTVLALIDARRGEVFAGAYRPGQEPVAPRALAPDTLASMLTPAARRLAVGDGAVRFRADLDALGVTVPEDSSPLHRVSGASICALASPLAGTLDRNPAPFGAVVPEYLRRPDAEIALEAAAS
jgi:tRNA threonylcarbamoyladenosine biosynthesis protein TsaB